MEYDDIADIMDDISCVFQPYYCGGIMGYNG
jgi:hypothetical protein